MIIIPLGKFHYKSLPIGVDNSTDILQQKLNYLVQGLECIHAYIYAILILTNGNWTDHVHRL